MYYVSIFTITIGQVSISICSVIACIQLLFTFNIWYSRHAPTRSPIYSHSYYWHSKEKKKTDNQTCLLWTSLRLRGVLNNSDNFHGVREIASMQFDFNKCAALWCIFKSKKKLHHATKNGGHIHQMECNQVMSLNMRNSDGGESMAIGLLSGN